MIVDPSPSVPVTSEQREQLRATWPHAGRLCAAFRVALDVEACADLLAGRHVPVERLDQEQLRRSVFVRLETAADVLEVAA